MALCALFIALMVMGTFIRIPTPFALITLQTQIALLAGICLGSGWGSLSILLYVFLGLIGVPIFAGGGGFAYVFQPTFGYLIGFAVAAAVSGAIIRDRTCAPKRIFLGLGIGLATVYIVGVAYSALILTVYLKESMLLTEFLLGYVFVTLPKDVILAALSVPLIKCLLPATL